MFKGISRLLGGDPIRKQIEEYADIVERINALERKMQGMSDDALRASTATFRERLQSGETLDELLVDVFAVVREVAQRTIGLRPYDVQLIGGIVLHEGKIAEMRTGEGKTLVATLPIYLNALDGKGVHLVTVNDYLARRDARWMGPVFDFLGLSVGVLQQAARSEGGRKALLYDPSKESAQEDAHQLRLVDRKEAYEADITYGTNNEFGFDYLRDNMARTIDARSQRGHQYAILDEVDNILIDEARTPLIISGPSQEDPGLYLRMSEAVKRLQPGDYEVEEKNRSVALTEIGEDNLEEILGTPLRDPDRPEDVTPQQADLLGHLEQALRAEHLYTRNKQYVVQGGRVIIVDEFTGRLMPGRRWSDGLHQAVEAKEIVEGNTRVRVGEENVTYATVTLQNYFRMYAKLAGMTGTALTEAEEFNKIYKVDVTPLPMNLEFRAMQHDSDLVEVEYRENGNQFAYYARTADTDSLPAYWKRKDYPDVVFRTEEAKLRAVTQEIFRRHVLGQPLLVGTTSVELSERLSKRLSSSMLERLSNVMILRHAFMQAHEIEEGLRIEELEPLNTPLDDLRASEMRPIARELNISLNPAKPENLSGLLQSLELDEQAGEQVAALIKSGIPHNVLNAKKHMEESQIIEGAGAKGAVTIATNMAGRGVDIVLGGNLNPEISQNVTRVARGSYEQSGNLDEREEMGRILRAGSNSGYGKASHLQKLERWRREFQEIPKEAAGIYQDSVDEFDRFIENRKVVLKQGGLHVIGCVRHEARRIDNQLRGRAARQGDPGSSQFFLSLEDELMRLFGGTQVSGIMERLNIDDAVPIAHNIVNRTIEQAQSRVEGANFDTRKHLLEYDDVLNQQREVFYGQRNRVFTKADLSEDVDEMLSFEIDRHIESSQADPEGHWKLLAWLEEIQPSIEVDREHAFPSFMLRLLIEQLAKVEGMDALKQALLATVKDAMGAHLEHLDYALNALLEQAVSRLDQQVAQQLDFAEMALEGAVLEAEESGEAVDARALVDKIQSLSGIRLNMTGADLQRVEEDPHALRHNLPQWIEMGLSARVWAGLVRGLERRIGESLGLDPTLSLPIDWDMVEAQLRQALHSLWAARTERVVGEVERDLETALARVEVADPALLTSLLVRMSYGREAFFDRKTHQRRAKVVSRFTYVFSAARLIEGLSNHELGKEVGDHLTGARVALGQSIGRSEFARLAGTGFEHLETVIQGWVLRHIGREAFEEAMQAGTLSSLRSETRKQVEAALGFHALNEAYRGLILSVGDRLWVDYLTQMEGLRTSIGLEAYAQRDPLVQYKRRAFDMFEDLLADVRAGIVSQIFRLRTTAQVGAMSTSPSRPEKRSAATEARPQQPRKKKRRKRRR